MAWAFSAVFAKVTRLRKTRYFHYRGKGLFQRLLKALKPPLFHNPRIATRWKNTMPTAEETPLTVFYSWQSDLPSSVSKSLIKRSLDQAANKLNEDHNYRVRVTIDDATRNMPGSPNIADAIFSKIRLADVFVCDLTKITTFEIEGQTRNFCNPNVAIELGYAVRVLGWDRIIVAFNEDYGKVPDDLPFDVHGQRITRYSCLASLDKDKRPTNECKTQIKNAVGQLTTALESALSIIFKLQPKRPGQGDEKSHAETQRERDLSQLKNVFYWISLPVMDTFIEKLSRAQISTLGLHFCEQMSEQVDSSGFHFYDSELRTRVLTFARGWQSSCKHKGEMVEKNSGHELFFNLEPGASESEKKSVLFTQSSALPLRKALDTLLEYVHSRYIEIDTSACGSEALKQSRVDEKNAHG